MIAGSDKKVGGFASPCYPDFIRIRSAKIPPQGMAIYRTRVRGCLVADSDTNVIAEETLTYVFRRNNSLVEIAVVTCHRISLRSPSGALNEQFYRFWFRLRHNRSEEHTSELQSRENLVCRLLLEKK